MVTTVFLGVLLAIPVLLAAQSTRTFAACLQAEQLRDRGERFLSNRQYGLAIDDFQAALKLCPSQSIVLLSLARAYRQGRQFSQAQHAVELFLKDNPTSSEAQYLLAKTCFDLGRHREAQATLRKILRLRPHDPDALTLLGETLIGLKQYSQALPVLQEAAKLRPRDLETLYVLASIYKHEQDYFHAIGVYKDALRLNPDSYETYNNLGGLYGLVGKDDLALDAFRKSQALTRKAALPDDAPSRNIAVLLILKRRYPEAVAAAEDSVKLNPRSPQNQFLLGKALYYQGEVQRAIKPLQTAADLDKRYAEPHYLLGTIYAKLDQKDAALHEREAFRALKEQTPARPASTSRNASPD